VAVEFRILGPLEVLDDHGRPLALGGAKQRGLLAALLLDAGAVVSSDRLVDVLWGEDPPASARSVLQVHVANLRKLLEPGRATRAAGGLLRTQPPGYLLDLAGHRFDLADFDRLVAQGRAALDAGDPAAAAGTLREALALWRGPAASDVAAELGAPGALARLEERRLAILEQRIEVDLTLGRHAELVGELESLVAAHPLRERLRGQLMVALYRCGRQAEALDAYRKARETLADELGIDPSRPLQELERAVLAQDPVLEWAPPEEPAPPRPPPPPPPMAATPDERHEERKVVTVLWCSLARAGGDRIDPEDAQARLRPYVERVRAEIQRFGGTAERYPGQVVMGVFGAPVAHEDDPERAVRTGLRILELAEELDRADPGLRRSPRVGIGTGDALVAVQPGQEPGEGLIAGDVIDAAARLSALAPPAGVVADEATWRPTRRKVTYEALDPPENQGPGGPRAWLAVAARSRSGAELGEPPATPFVGREDELDLLKGLFRRAVREQSVQLATVTGEPGVGKSRLVRELLAYVDQQPELVAWRQGRCLPYGDGIAFWALGEIVKAEAGILESDGPGEAAAKLAAAVEAVEERPAERGWLEARLSPLAGLAGTATQREEAFAAWRQFLEAVAGRNSLVVVVEDLHWADAALLDFLQHLVEWSAAVPLLVVCTARPELVERTAGWGTGARNATTIALAPLADEHIARLGAALLDQAVMPSELQSLLLERAGGNPLYAEELVRLLNDQGLLSRRGRTLRLRTDAEVPLPDTVQAIIAARLDTLAPQRKALLQDAAVVGQVFWSGALAAMGQVDQAEVLAGLHELARKELLRPARRSSIEGQAEYAFWHVLVRDVAYSQLPRAARAGKHRRAAEWLEALAPDRAGDRAELLAHHWEVALRFARAAGQETGELAGRARLALRGAGDRAMSFNSFAAAARWYDAALAIWPADDPGRLRLVLRLGEARLYAESAGGELLAEARDGLLAAGDREGAAEAEARLCLLASWRGHYEQELRHARQAVELLEHAGPSPAKALVLANLANSLMFGDDTAETIRVGRQALAIAERLGLEEQRVRALMAIGIVRVGGGDPGGLEDLELALRIAVERNLPQAGTAYGNLAAGVIPLGDLARGFGLQASGAEAAERFGLRSTLSWLRSERILQDYWQGRWQQALAAAEQRLAESAAGAPSDADILCRFARGWIRLARQDLPGALEDAVAAVDLGRSTGFVDRAPALALQARVLLASGRVEEADDAAADLLEVLAARGALPTAPDWSGPLAFVLHTRGRGAELAGLLARAPTPTPWLQAAAAITAGEFERAAGIYAEIGSRPDEAFSRLQAARQLQAGGRHADAAAQLQRAVAFHRQVQATAHLHEAETLAGRSTSSA
jgi:DNA-binding SARP family transcriptional activator/class 3 adenylate cyclase